MTTPPAAGRLGALAWAREHLFRTWWDSLITIIAGGGIVWLFSQLLIWSFTGAEWQIIRTNLTGFMTGRFPRDELWRLAAALLIGAFAAGLLLGLLGRDKEKKATGTAVREVAIRTWPLLLMVGLLLLLAWSWGPVLLVIAAVGLVVAARALSRRLPRRLDSPVVATVLLSPIAVVLVISAFGGVGWDDWGGVLLTLFLAVGGIGLSFPLGVLLALGRRSTLPVARWMSVGYIETVRGVPLIALLFMGFAMLALFLPAGVNPPSLVIRAVVVFTLFTAAYIAEIVRGGLQAVPHGQVEAAMAVGLSPARITFYIVLPQALRAVIPALVGQFISLFKDTSLVAIVGLIEILGIAQVVTQQEAFRGQGLITETLLFSAVLYWVGSFTMSRESQRLEKRLGVGER